MTLPAMLLAFALVPAARATAQEPQPPATTQEPAATVASGSAQGYIDAGLAAFRRRRFAVARKHFEDALAAEPDSAAANFYLGYTIYKIAEPKRPFHPDKQKAADLFAKAYQIDPQFKPVWGPRT